MSGLGAAGIVAGLLAIVVGFAPTACQGATGAASAVVDVGGGPASAAPGSAAAPAVPGSGGPSGPVPGSTERSPPGVPMHRVGGGAWRPLYPAEGEDSIEVGGFLLDERPVTNAEFLTFVLGEPRWRRDGVAPLFADQGYLAHWSGPDVLGDAGPTRPVTHVSWWAARAYCKQRGARLPAEAEWERAAMASETQADATGDPAVAARILGWYSRPGSAELAEAGAGPANVWGVRDLHAGVWEWVEDFQSALVSVDNREDGATDTARFCGAGAVSAQDKEDYAAFMRLAFRSSLQATFTTRNLGFRCARDLPDGDHP